MGQEFGKYVEPSIDIEQFAADLNAIKTYEGMGYEAIEVASMAMNTLLKDALLKKNIKPEEKVQLVEKYIEIWRKKPALKNYRVNLSEANLAMINLPVSANLIGVNLSGANLSGASLKRIDLRWANLKGANLEGANLAASNLRGADLLLAKLRLVDLSGANLELARLEGARLNGANLRGANLELARLAGVNLAGAELKLTNLKGAGLRGAELRGCNIEKVNLIGADLSEANLCFAYLDEVNLEGANLKWANLEGASLASTNLEGADLEMANLIGTNIGDSNLAMAKLSGSILLVNYSFFAHNLTDEQKSTAICSTDQLAATINSLLDMENQKVIKDKIKALPNLYKAAAHVGKNDIKEMQDGKLLTLFARSDDCKNAAEALYQRFPSVINRDRLKSDVKSLLKGDGEEKSNFLAATAFLQGANQEGNDLNKFPAKVVVQILSEVIGGTSNTIESPGILPSRIAEILANRSQNRTYYPLADKLNLAP